jgi:hypothetical protein
MTKASANESKKQPSIRERALSLLGNEDFFGELRKALKCGGLVGEVRNALAIYIVAISSLLDHPLSVLIKGPSSGGKNFLATRVLDLLPKTAIREISSSSKTAWNYGANDFRHKVVYLQERNDASGAVHPVRLLISEQKIVRTVTVRKGNEFISKEFVANGPIASISTTTKNRIEVDDETRHLSVWIDESPAQTLQILKRRNSTAANLGKEKEELEVWHEAYRLLERRASVPVDLPDWFVRIIDLVFVDDVRVRRYFPAFQEAIRTIALIRSFQTHPEDYEPDDSISARFSDYATATCIFEDLFVESLHLADDDCMATLKAVKEIAATAKDGAAGANQLATKLKISPDMAYARLRAASEAGAIVRANEPEKNNIKRYRPAERPRFVPSPKEVFEKVRPTSKPTIQFTDPVTGELVKFARK